MTKIKMELDHYQVLGVSPKASHKEIRREYKSLCQKFHPDRNPENAEHFMRIRKAYDCLSDPRRKAIYDQGIKQGINPEEFKKVLGAITEKTVIGVLAAMSQRPGLKFLRTVKLSIGQQKIDSNAEKEEFEGKAELIANSLKKVKQGQESIIITNLIKQAGRIKATLITIDVTLAVIAYLQEDTHTIVWEEDKEPPRLGGIQWQTLGQ